MNQNMYILSYNINIGNKNILMIKRLLSALCGSQESASWRPQLLSIINWTQKCGLFLICPLIEGCFYRPFLTARRSYQRWRFIPKVSLNYTGHRARYNLPEEDNLQDRYYPKVKKMMEKLLKLWKYQTENLDYNIEG